MDGFVGKVERFLAKHIIPPLRDKPWNVRFSTSDSMNVLFLTFLSLIVRFHKFWFPANVVFDEIHFGNFTNFYLNHTYFFDVHPPLAKLLIAAHAHLSGYDGHITFGSIFGQPYPDEWFISLRVAPLLLSSFVPSLMYIGIRLAAFSRVAGFCAGFMTVFETSMICEGRFLLTDGILHFFVALCIAVSMYWFSLVRNTREWTVWMYLTSLSLAAAASVKFTALSLCFVLGFHECVCLFFENALRLDGKLYHELCVRAMQLFAPVALFQLLLWTLHLSLLWYVGDPSPFDESLVNKTADADWTKLLRPSIFIRLLETLFQVQVSNMCNYKSHPAMSRPIDWPLLTDVSVGFWAEDGRHVTCMGNLFVYYLAILGWLLCLIGYRKRCYFRAVIYIVGYLTSYLPFFLVPRTVFLYHYIIPLMFACACFGIMLDFWMDGVVKATILVVVCALVVFGWTEWGPLVYARQMTEHEFQSRVWNKVWIYGRSGRNKWIDAYDSKFRLIESQNNAYKQRMERLHQTV
jgi:dolichyl-phosphate-mannose--protein O-mannosyl transferase